MNAKFVLPKIYPITQTGIASCPPIEQFRRLIDAGAGVIQLRDKTSTSADFFDTLRAALELARPHSARIVVNDRVDIALAAGAAAVHLGQDDLPIKAARDLLGAEAVIGISTHSVKQARAAAQLPVDYIAIGPIFETRTKENPDPIVGLEGFREVRRAIGNIPLVAIGGITADNIRCVFEAGADSAALIGALYSNNDIEDNYARLTALVTVN